MKLNDRMTRLLIYAAGSLLFTYVVSRAYFVSFTSDECFTYLNYVRGGWENINHLTYTNNHLLNTWLMKCCSILFGDSEFSLRLPNILSYLLFLYYGAQLLLKLKDKRATLAGWLFLNLNPFVLDFFSLARGYGISMGLMMMSIYCLYSLFYAQRSVKNILLTIISGCLAVFANLTTINFLIAVVILMIAASLFLALSPRVNGIIWKNNRWKIVILPALALTMFLVYLLPVLFQLKRTGNFDFGGNTGIWQDTVISLIGNSFYGFHFWHRATFDLAELEVLFFYFIYYLIEFVIIAVLINYFLKRIYFLYTNRSIRPDGFIWFLFLLVMLCVSAIWFQHQFFHIPFSQDRAGIYLIPLFSCFFIFWMDSIRSAFSKKVWTGISASIAFILFIPTINWSYCHWWKYDAGISEAMNAFSKNLNEELQPGIMVGVDPKYRSAFNYYRLRYELWKVDPSNEDDLCERGRFDYYLVPSARSFSYDGKLINSYPISEISLIRSQRNWNTGNRKQFPAIDYEDPASTSRHGVEASDYAFDGKHNEVTDPQNDFAANFTDTIRDAEFFKKSCINFSAMLKRKNSEAEGTMVISLERKGKIIFWRSMNIREFVIQENKWTRARFTAYLSNDLQDGDLLRCYFWNQSKFDICVDHQTLEIYNTDL